MQRFHYRPTPALALAVSKPAELASIDLPRERSMISVSRTKPEQPQLQPPATANNAAWRIRSADSRSPGSRPQAEKPLFQFERQAELTSDPVAPVPPSL